VNLPRSPRLPSLAAILVMLSAGPVLAACGSSGGSSSASSASGGNATSATSSSAGGKTLIELDTDVAPSLDPDGTAGSDPGFEQAYVNMANTLVDYPSTEKDGVDIPDYQVGRDGFSPSLASSYTHKGNAWTFTLRKGVYSCADNELTSADVVYTMARGKSVSGADPTTDFVGTTGSIFNGDEDAANASAKAKLLNGEVTTDGKFKVTFHLASNNDLFPKVLTTWLMAPLDAKVMKAHATKSDPWSHTYMNTTNAPGFGPYCLTSWQKGSEMDFSANPHWYGPKPTYSHIVVRQVPSDSQRAAALIGGSANVVTGLTPAEYQAVASHASVLSWNNPSNFLSIGVNYKYAPFTDTTKGRLLRQAIADALPYAEIAKEVYYGKFVKAEGLVPSDAYGYTPVNDYTEDLTKAKALEAQAGYPDGKGLPASSSALTLTYVSEDSSILQPLSELIQSALAKLGMKITLNPIPAAQEQADEFSKYDLGMWLRNNQRALVPDAGYVTRLFFLSKAAGALEPSTNYDNPVVDKLYAKSGAVVGAARVAYLHQIQKIIMQDLPLIPVGSADSQLGVTKGITGWLGNTYDLVFWAGLKG
jgi:peptide/nickel transport system substrate-binding protein